MIYHVCQYLACSVSVLNVVHYVSFRAMAALLSSLIFSFIFGNWFIEQSKTFFRSKARAYTPESHRSKDNMPTMGGLFIILVVVCNTLLWANLSQPYVWIFLWNLLGFGFIGLLDDVSKIKRHAGMSAKTKFCMQLLVAGSTTLLLVSYGLKSIISFPFLKNLQPNIGILFVLWSMFIIIGCSNAVNLTDGLDGLAINSLIPNFVTFSLICFLAGNFTLAYYLHIPFAHCAEISVAGATLIGASIGFLWYNTYPAQIFMGDVGSLALGASLAFMALAAKQEILLALSGGLFVMEALSVIVQVASFRYCGKRLFRMAPIHHHFELLGWQESKITVRFGIISLILCILAVLTLKLR